MALFDLFLRREEAFLEVAIENDDLHERLFGVRQFDRVPFGRHLPARRGVVLRVVEFHLQFAVLQVVLAFAVIVVAGDHVERAVEVFGRVELFEVVLEAVGREFAVEVVAEGEDGGERLVERLGEIGHGVGDGRLLFIAFGAEVAEGQEVDAGRFEVGGGLAGVEEAGTAGEGGGAEDDGAAERFAAGDGGGHVWKGEGGVWKGEGDRNEVLIIAGGLGRREWGGMRNEE